MTSPQTLRADKQPRLPRELVAALREFPDTHVMLSVWRLYPYVSEADDQATDYWACRQASELFVAFLSERGMTARLVLGVDAEAPFLGYHWWVRVDCPLATANVDWTARQFHNLHHPPLPGTKTCRSRWCG